jgi:hypothetical protein
MQGVFDAVDERRGDDPAMRSLLAASGQVMRADHAKRLAAIQRDLMILDKDMRTARVLHSARHGGLAHGADPRTLELARRLVSLKRKIAPSSSSASPTKRGRTSASRLPRPSRRSKRGPGNRSPGSKIPVLRR